MSVPDLIKTTIQERERAKTVLANFDKSIAELRKQLTIPCTNCGAIHQIGELTYVQIVYYQKPYGCTMGDYEYDSDGSEFICPTCDVHNNLSFMTSRHSVPWDKRDNFNSNPEKQFKRIYKSLFGKIIKLRDSERKDDWGVITYKTKQNTWVEEHLDEFGLKIE